MERGSLLIHSWVPANSGGAVAYQAAPGTIAGRQHGWGRRGFGGGLLRLGLRRRGLGGRRAGHNRRVRAGRRVAAAGYGNGQHRRREYEN